MDKMVSHLGHGGEGKAWEWQRKSRSMPTSYSTSHCIRSDFYVKDKSASILLKVSSFSPANLTHQAPFLLPLWFFGYHDFVHCWNLATLLLTIHLIFNHRLLHIVIYLITCLSLIPREAVWLTEHGSGFSRSGFECEFRHLLLTWSWVTVSSFIR